MYNVEYSNFGSSCGLFVSNKVCQARIDAGLNPDGSDPRDAEADRLLAQAMIDAQNRPDKSWTATQTAGVIIASLVGITLLAVVIVKIKKKRKG